MAKAKYYTLMSGLRGCYMPDSVYVLKCTSRRELKAIVRDECEHVEKRPSQRAIASYVAEVWRRNDLFYPLVLSTGEGYGLHLSNATRREYEDFINAD